MKMLPSKDDTKNSMFLCMKSEGGLVNMGVYRVMFGYRIRAWFTGQGFCNLDWCAGGEWKDVERLYSICLAVLKEKPEDRNCFSGVPPCSKIKPFFMDDEFMEAISKYKVELIKLEKPKYADWIC